MKPRQNTNQHQQHKTHRMKNTETPAEATPIETITETAVAVEETPTNVVPFVAPKKAAKQAFVRCSTETKEAIQALSKEFVGPGVTKEYPMTEKETIDLLYHVATNHRLEMVPAISEDGTPVYDGDGQPVFETVDRFALEAKRIFSLRDQKPAKVDHNSPDALRAEMARIAAKLAKLGMSV